MVKPVCLDFSIHEILKFKSGMMEKILKILNSNIKGKLPIFVKLYVLEEIFCLISWSLQHVEGEFTWLYVLE